MNDGVGDAVLFKDVQRLWPGTNDARAGVERLFVDNRLLR